MKTRILLALFGLLAFREPGFGLAQEQVGPAASAVAQQDRPKDIVEVVRHPSRVYSLWINGMEDFYFQATPAEVNELAALFAKARMRDHEVRIEAGSNTVNAIGGATFDYNVRLHISGGISLAAMREKESEGTLEPVLTIYSGEGRALLQQLKLPDQAIVECNIAGVDLKGKGTKPKRQTWYGVVQFDDGRPAADFEHGVSTYITLWEEDSPDGIRLGTPGIKGFFQAVFSEDELAALRQGRSWLTMTVGNYASVAKKDDPRFPPDKLARDSERATPQRVAGPTYYYGRILFEDGTPAVLDPKLWRGANVRVDFSFLGPVGLDSEGNFKVTFTPEQLAQLKMQKPRKNIYIPVDEQRSGATETFPADMLSTDKAKAGVVRISKPVFTYDPAKAPSLLGQALPAMQALKIDALPAALSNRMVLLCFFDLQQRPSRNCVAELAGRAAELDGKGVSMLAVQASPADPNALADFAKSNNLLCPLGRIESEEQKTRFNWGIKSQPWLILTDRSHIIRAEGFPIGELNEKLSAIR